MSETTTAYRPETDPQMMKYWMRQGPKTAAFLLVIPGCATVGYGAGLLVWGLIVSLTD